MYPVGKMSDRNTTCSSGIPSGIFWAFTSAHRTRRYSACPPGMPPVRWLYPYSPAGECPISAAAISAFGLEVSQQEYSCFWQNQQSPQAMSNGTTMRSPFLNCVTAAPTSTTSPIGSWPRTSPDCMVGM
jgi:hypothetical protein